MAEHEGEVVDRIALAHGLFELLMRNAKPVPNSLGIEVWTSPYIPDGRVVYFCHDATGKKYIKQLVVEVGVDEAAAPSPLPTEGK